MTHPLSSADINIFSPEISKFCYIKKYRCKLNFDTQFLILLNFFESSKIFLINVVTIFMMSAKVATLGLFKIMVFSRRRYDVIISVHDVTNQIFSLESNYTVGVVMWPKFGNSSNSYFSIFQFSNDLIRKTSFIEVWSWFKISNLDWL